MSKYKLKAEEILENISNRNIDEDGNRVYYQWEVIKAMNQLAEEVENKIATNLYTKEQVEELLQKQRELCANKAKIKRSVGYPDYEMIDEDSILNAKFKF